MTPAERQAAAARIITAHLPNRRILASPSVCYCGKSWSPLHVAKALDGAGLLCALREVAR